MQVELGYREVFANLWLDLLSPECTGLCTVEGWLESRDGTHPAGEHRGGDPITVGQAG